MLVTRRHPPLLQATPESVELHYYSSRPGLWPIVVGRGAEGYGGCLLGLWWVGDFFVFSMRKQRRFCCFRRTRSNSLCTRVLLYRCRLVCSRAWPKSTSSFRSPSTCCRPGVWTREQTMRCVWWGGRCGGGCGRGVGRADYGVSEGAEEPARYDEMPSLLLKPAHLHPQLRSDGIDCHRAWPQIEFRAAAAAAPSFISPPTTFF